MTKIEEISHTFRLIERYECYKIKKMWGIMLVLFGIMRLSFYCYEVWWILIFLPSLPGSSYIFDLTGIYFLYILLTLIVSLYGLYVYINFRKTVRREGVIFFEHDIRFGLALFSIWFVSSNVLSLFRPPPPLPFIDLQLLLLAGAFFISYFFLRGIKNEFKELAYIGLFLAGVSVPIGFFKFLYYNSIIYFPVWLFILIDTIPLAVSYFSGGWYQLKNSMKILEGEN
ncbi:MAG: hypothetical protein ACFFBD_24345 [Candidatus Hodarchaeota archaeon]